MYVISGRTEATEFCSSLIFMCVLSFKVKAVVVTLEGKFYP